MKLFLDVGKRLSKNTPNIVVTGCFIQYGNGEGNDNQLTVWSFEIAKNSDFYTWKPESEQPDRISPERTQNQYWPSWSKSMVQAITDFKDHTRAYFDFNTSMPYWFERCKK